MRVFDRRRSCRRLSGLVAVFGLRGSGGCVQAGVTADEVIVEMVGSLPADRPLVVATNDGEVRNGARAGGANVISSEQLLSVARR